MGESESQPPVSKPARRRFRLTPGHLLVGLLLDGFLWLSEHFRWFAFDEHKGWTVLIAAASVGAAMLLMFLWFAVSLLFRGTPVQSPLAAVSGRRRRRPLQLAGGGDKAGGEAAVRQDSVSAVRRYYCL